MHVAEGFRRKSYPTDIFLFKVNDRNIRTMGEICSKLTIKTPERRNWRRSSVFIVNFEQISQIVLVFLLLLWTIKCRMCKDIEHLECSRCKPQYILNRSVFMRFGILELQNGVTRNDVTLRVINSKIFIEILLLSFWIDFVKH